MTLTPTRRPVAPSGAGAYEEAVERLRDQYQALPAGAPVRLAKRTSNLFRPRSPATRPGLDVSAFDGVISIDCENATADVGGMTTYEHLVDGLLPYGFMPLVVPELKTITLGGALTGLGIESSSFRNGLPHESVIEMDILTGDGRIVTARPDNEHRDLFYGFPNSYGTLGYTLRARIELERVSRYVHLRHIAADPGPALVELLSEICSARRYQGDPVAFVDATVFGPAEAYVTVGSWSEEAPATSDYTHMGIYYRSIQSKSEDWLTARDYLWRWDTDWFWCSRAFLAQRPLVRMLAGRRFLRSDVYWKILAFEARHQWKARLDRRRGRPEQENVIQDVEIPAERAAEWIEAFLREVPISPFWICPLKQRNASAVWPLYRLDPSKLYLNFGFWSRVDLPAGADADHYNRWVEAEVERLGGRKSLYSSAFYEEERFWELYNGPVYRQLKDRYDPEGRLLDLYAKCVGNQ